MEKLVRINSKTFYILFALIYIIGGSSAIIISYLYNFNKEYVGVAFLLGTIVALILRKSSIDENKLEFTSKGLSKNNFKILITIFFLSCTVLILIFSNSVQNYYLPLQYFLVVTIASFAIISQILLSNTLSNFREKTILLEIILLSTIVYTSFLFLFPSAYGNDAPYHVEFIKQILTSGHLSSYGQYQNYPIYHILFVVNVLVAKIANFKLVQVVLLIVQLIFVLFIFSLSKKFFNTKIGLISSLILSFCPYISQPKYFYFPGSFSAIFFILAFYLIFTGAGKDFRYSLLLIITFLSLIFSHPMTPVILIFAFIIILIDSKLELKKNMISWSSILFVTVATLAWWMKPTPVSSGNLFNYMIISIKSSIETMDYTAVGRATLSSLVNPTSIILNDLGFIIVVTLSIVGAIYLLGKYFNKSKNNYYKDKSILAIITLIFIPVPYILAIIYPQSLPNRWFPFIEVFASIFAGYAIFLLFETLINKKIIYKFIGILSVSCLIFLLVSNPVINPNSQLYAQDLSVRSALTTSEMSSLNFIGLYPEQNNIKGNSKFIIYLYKNYNNSLNPENPETYSNGLIVLRSYELEKGFTIPLWGSKGKLLDSVYPTDTFKTFLNNSNELYDNGKLWIYDKDS